MIFFIKCIGIDTGLKKTYMDRSTMNISLIRSIENMWIHTSQCDTKKVIHENAYQYDLYTNNRVQVYRLLAIVLWIVLILLNIVFHIG